ncbi:hypothetical protein [Rhizobium leguminosarum]|uniref:hypothetical protein n=1 Tax=Rhizobium leguminosarum TaxID=384 RepID=UPI003F99EDAD
MDDVVKRDVAIEKNGTIWTVTTFHDGERSQRTFASESEARAWYASERKRLGIG